MPVPARVSRGPRMHRPARAVARRSLRRTPVRATLIAAMAGAAVACPIQRPPVPADYYEFREALGTAVADSAEVALAGNPAYRSRLEERFPELASYVETDSLFVALAADSLLSPLAGVLGATLNRALESEHVSGGVRNAFRNPDGQRLAVDAILIGLGRALRRLDARDARPPP